MKTTEAPADERAELPDPFGLESVTACKAPDGAEGENWRRYTLTQGQTTITGYRQGSKNEVICAANEMVVRLNERRAGKTGRVHLTPSPKRR